MSSPRHHQPGDPTSGRIILRLRRVMILRGFVHHRGRYKGMPNLQLLHRETGIMYAALHSYLHDGDKMHMMGFDALARLCRVLDCTPGDLLHFDYQPSARRAPPLEQLFRDDPTADPYRATRISAGSDNSNNSYHSLDSDDSDTLLQQW